MKNQSSPPETQSVPQTKNISKTLIIFLGLLFLAAIGAAGYFAYQNYQFKKQTPQPQSSLLPIATISPSPTLVSAINWEIYTNPDYKYSINIPGDWEIFEQTGDNSIVSIRPVGLEEIPISVTVIENQKGLTLDQWVNSKYGFNHPREQKAINNRDVVIVKNNISPYPSITYLMAKFSNFYELSCSTLKEEYLAVCVQIISTFKFADKPEGVESLSLSCGGWNTSGNVICNCSGELTKPSCPPNSICDAITYYCQGQCTDCCYQGFAENHPLPKCNN